MPTGWWVDLGPGTHKLEGEFQNGTCQLHYPHGGMSSPKWLLLASLSRMSPSYLLPLWEALQDQQVGLTQGPFKLLLLPWALKCVRFCVYPLTVESLFPTAL